MNPPARHQIHMRAKDVLHALLEFDQLEQGKALGTVEIEEDIDIGSVDPFVAGDRTEEEECTDARPAKFRFMLPQQADDLIAFHITLNSAGLWRKPFIPIAKQILASSLAADISPAELRYALAGL